MNLLDRLEFEGVKIASMQKRSFAFLIDELIISLLFYAIYYDTFISATTPAEISALLGKFMLELMGLRLIYQTFFTWYMGASFGKYLLKLAVVDSRGLYRPSLGASFVRACVRQISEFCFYLGFIWAFNTPVRQAWEDLAAKTVVIDVSN